jgi:hypothetical protein
MLTNSQQDYLYQIIAAAIGEDISIKRAKKYFNDETVVVVETMIAGNKQCNAAMKELFKGLVSGATGLSRGWLKKALKGSKIVISKTDMKGYGCMVVTKSRWKTPILNTTI